MEEGARMPRRGPDVLKVPEVAADLRVDRKTVYSLIREGELRALRMGRTLRITRQALEEFKAGGRAQSA
jgi:excisionase family DNA binding protein